MITPIQSGRQRITSVSSSPSGADVKPSEDQGETAHQQSALLAQQTSFNFALQERAELMREFNELRALQMEQLKHDDEIVKKWIDLI